MVELESVSFGSVRIGWDLLLAIYVLVACQGLSVHGTPFPTAWAVLYSVIEIACDHFIGVGVLRLLPNAHNYSVNA